MWIHLPTLTDGRTTIIVISRLYESERQEVTGDHAMNTARCPELVGVWYRVQNWLVSCSQATLRAPAPLLSHIPFRGSLRFWLELVLRF